MEKTMSGGSVQELTQVSEIALDLIRKRRTIRQFTDEDISPEQVETLLEMAMCAPNRLDSRPWHFVVIRDKALQKQLTDILRVRPYLEIAPVVIAVCGLPRVSPTWLIDLSAATENIMLAATAMGLGVAWVGNPGAVLWDRCEDTLLNALSIPRDDIGVFQKLFRFLNRFLGGNRKVFLDSSIRIPTLVAVGHPAEERAPHGRHDRFDLNRIHYGRW
jgi:nitroreductase